MRCIFTLLLAICQLFGLSTLAQQSSGLSNYNSSPRMIVDGSIDRESQTGGVREQMSALLNSKLTALRRDKERIALEVTSIMVGDSIQVVYEYSREGLVELTIELVERITYRFRLQDVRHFEIDTEEFNFLSIHTDNRLNLIYCLQERFLDGEYEEDYRFAASFPVKTENLELLNRHLKELRQPL